MIQMLELANKDTEIIIITVFHTFKKTGMTGC